MISESLAAVGETVHGLKVRAQDQIRSSIKILNNNTVTVELHCFLLSYLVSEA